MGEDKNKWTLWGLITEDTVSSHHKKDHVGGVHFSCEMELPSLIQWAINYILSVIKENKQKDMWLSYIKEQKINQVNWQVK